ncbi:MAG: hypothetical protein IJJ77_04980 [Paludibacteraceae bacterium]|nr:hypothetical protein [Paludibacteraceae bacterium]
MVKYNIKCYMTIIAVLTVGFFVLYVALFNMPIIDSISYCITTLGVFAFLFVSYAWRWKVFEGWLVPFPNISGKWKGYLESSYEGARKRIPIELSIRQTFLHIQIKLSTNESKSTSIVAAFNIDDDRNIKQICYTYLNEPKAKFQEKSPIHYGSIILDIDANDKMSGKYWTGRKTTGDISVSKCENKNSKK